MGRRNLVRISAPLPLINSIRMRPLLAWSISLDSTFKKPRNRYRQASCYPSPFLSSSWPAKKSNQIKYGGIIFVCRLWFLYFSATRGIHFGGRAAAGRIDNGSEPPGKKVICSFRSNACHFKKSSNPSPVQIPSFSDLSSIMFEARLVQGNLLKKVKFRLYQYHRWDVSKIFRAGSRINKIPGPGSWSASKNLSILTQKSFPSYRKYDPVCYLRSGP